MIYLDNAATTKPYEDVLNVHTRLSNESFANSSSIHFAGSKSSRLFSQICEKCLSLLNVRDSEFIYTSGATESINLAIKGYCLKNKTRGNHIITSSVEHPAVLESIEWLKQFGFESTILPVNKDGVVDVNILKESIKPTTILVSIMAVNNETGAINDIPAIANILKGYPKIAFHVDATQAICKVNLDYSNVDMFSFSGHKFHGLKGTGALIKKKNISLMPILSGGGHQDNNRSGTIDIPGAGSLYKALELSNQNYKNDLNKVTVLWNKAYAYLSLRPDKYVVNSPLNGLKNILNFSLLTKKASVVVEALSNKEIMVSSISACHSKKEAISYVVMNMTNDEIRAHNTIRISFDGNNTEEEIDILINELDKIVNEVRQ